MHKVWPGKESLIIDLTGKDESFKGFTLQVPFEAPKRARPAGRPAESYKTEGFRQSRGFPTNARN